MRNKKGITLIALVITIIVLLILAGVSLSLVMGNEGILEKVTNAVEKSKKATAEERIKIAVAGSFDREGKMNIDDLSENLKNVEKINETDLPIVKLPATVNVDGYTFIIEEKGTVELSGPKPIVSEVNITLKDGSIVPEDGVDDGTELKVTFTATMEKGEITSISPQLPYVTNGTEKEVNFTITGLVDGITSETEKTIDLRDYYKKTEFEVGDIIKKPSKFYGAIVDNYEVNASATDTVKNVVTTWRIFYAGKEPNGTENNIYLIADDYIEYTQAPNGKNGSTLVPKDTKYRIAFVNIYNDYNGGKFIYENSLAQNWLSGYLNYTTNENNVFPNRGESENINIRIAAYLMDTNVWNNYAGEKAKYAIGAPTIEMFCTSYKNTHPDSKLSYDMYDVNGYTWENGDSLLSDYNEIYIKPKISKAYGMWIASPHYEGNTYLVMYALYSGKLNHSNTGLSNQGLRPIICLKSETQLEKKANGIYSIK